MNLLCLLDGQISVTPDRPEAQDAGAFGLGCANEVIGLRVGGGVPWDTHGKLPKPRRIQRVMSRTLRTFDDFVCCTIRNRNTTVGDWRHLPSSNKSHSRSGY